MSGNFNIKYVSLLFVIYTMLLAPSFGFFLGQDALEFLKKRGNPKIPARFGKRQNAANDPFSRSSRLSSFRVTNTKRLFADDKDELSKIKDYYGGREFALNPTPFTPPIGMLHYTTNVGKRVPVFSDGYQETLPEVLEDIIPGVKPDDGVCRMEEAFQLLSNNWQNIITLVFKLGLADTGSDRK